MLTIHVLGYPSITFDALPVKEFISQKVLVLFCYLAIEPKPHGREFLASLFWGEMPQERAMSNLRQALHNIQKLVPNTIIVTRQTVQFKPEMTYQIDALNSVGDAQISIDLFLNGITIADATELENWISFQREHYRYIHLSRLEQHLDEAPEKQEDDAAHEIARNILRLDPFHEGAHITLTRVYVYRGQRQEALRNYQSFVEQLRTELDVQPSPALERIGQQLELAQQEISDNLPTIHASFIGRQHELDNLKTWLYNPSCRLITISGIGGIGKTHLSQKLARDTKDRFINGLRFIPLSQVQDPSYFYFQIAETLQLQLIPTQPTDQQILTYLKARNVLLIFDNFEHLVEHSLFISTILQNTADVKIIVTSREKLSLQEEWVYPLKGLALVKDETHSMSGQLFIERSQQRGHHHPLDLAQVEMICAELDGIPLGIELASALTSELSLNEIYESIHTNLDHLQSPWRNTPERHRSLRAIFESSWRLLTAEEQTVLAKLAVYNGSFSKLAFKAMWQKPLSLLQILVNKSLVQLVEDRYSLHDMVLYFAKEKLGEGAHTAKLQHLTFYSSYIQELTPLYQQTKIQERIAEFQKDILNIQQAWQTAVQLHDVETLNSMLKPIHRYFESSNSFQLGELWLENTLQELSLNDSIPEEHMLYGRILGHLTGIKIRLGKVSEAHQHAISSVEIVRQSADKEAVAFSLNLLGITHLYRGQYAEAQMMLEECASLYQTLNMPDRLKPLINLASMYSRSGDLEKALTACTEAYALAQEIEDPLASFHSVNGLGVSHFLIGNYAEAKKHYQKALQLSKDYFPAGESAILFNLADIAYMEKDYPTGVTLAKQAIQRAESEKTIRILVYANVSLGVSQTALGEKEEAKRAFIKALEYALQSQSEPMMMVALYGVGIWLMADEKLMLALTLLSVVAKHPASELDYRQRAQRLLNNFKIEALDEDILAKPPQDIGAYLLVHEMQ